MKTIELYNTAHPLAATAFAKATAVKKDAKGGDAK